MDIETLLCGGDAATPREIGDVGDRIEDLSTGSGILTEVGRAGSEGVGSSSSDASGVNCGGARADGADIFRWVRTPARAAAGFGIELRGDSGGSSPSTGAIGRLGRLGGGAGASSCTSM